MLLPKLDQSYVSVLDRFLQQLEETVPLSASQQAEIAKHQRIIRLRDDPAAVEESEIP